MTGSPSYPRLLAGVVAIERSGCVVLEGGALRHVFRGRDASRVILPVVRLLDGSRRADQVAEATGLELAEVTEAINLIADRGLLMPEAVSAAAASPPLAWLFVNGRIQRNGRQRDQASAVASMTSARVGIHGSGWLAESLGTSLHACGIRPAGFGDRFDVAGGPASTHLLCFTGEEPEEVWTEGAITARAAGVPVIAVAAAGSNVTLGPRIDAGNARCAECLAAALLPGSAGVQAAGAWVRALIGPLLAPEICRVVAGIEADDFCGKCVHVNLTTWSVQEKVLSGCVHWTK